MRHSNLQQQPLEADPSFFLLFVNREIAAWRRAVKFEGDETDWESRVLSISCRMPPGTERLKPFIRFVVEAVHSSKIYLINDGREEEAQKEKHYDLLIITKGPEGTGLAELQPLFDLAYLNEKHVHCTLHEQGVVMEGLKNGHIFYSLHCRPENLIYDDGITVFPELPPADMSTLKTKVLEKFRAAMSIARDFYNTAQFFNGEPASPLPAFFLGQAVELTYRSVLHALNGSCKKTHEIQVLQRQAKRCAGSLNRVLPADTPEGRRLISLLDKAYTGARYDPDFRTDPNDIATLLDLIPSLQKAAEELVVIRFNSSHHLKPL